MTFEEVIEDIEMEVAFLGERHYEWCYETTSIFASCLVIAVMKLNFPIEIIIGPEFEGVSIIGFSYSPWYRVQSSEVRKLNQEFNRLPHLVIDTEKGIIREDDMTE